MLDVLMLAAMLLVAWCHLGTGLDFSDGGLAVFRDRAVDGTLVHVVARAHLSIAEVHPGVWCYNPKEVAHVVTIIEGYA